MSSIALIDNDGFTILSESNVKNEQITETKTFDNPADFINHIKTYGLIKIDILCPYNSIELRNRLEKYIKRYKNKDFVYTEYKDNKYPNSSFTSNIINKKEAVKEMLLSKN